MRKLPFILLVLFILAFGACSTDFEVNEDWKEIDIVYGLLDKNDSVHYIKINKAFLNENEDAYRLAGIEDTIYHTDSLAVKMQEWRNGQMLRETPLEKVYLTNKDTGIFAFPGQYLYRLPLDYELNPTATYKLLVKNTSTGVEVSAETPVLDDAKLNNPNITSNINFQRGGNYITNINTGKGAKFYDMTMFINYFETDSANNTTRHTIRWPIYSKYLTANTNGNQELRFTIKGDDFYKMLLDNIPVRPSVTRKFDKLDVFVTGGGEEIYYYMNVYQPALGVVQKKPEYTNINNGQGILSSRNRVFHSVAISPNVIKSMNETKYPTSALNFVQ